MADRIKGITVEIGGDTTGLSKALNGVNKNIKNTQSQLKDVERLLKLDPANTELLSQKQKLLAQAVGETKGKLDTLKKANEGVTADNAKYEQWKAAYAPIQGEITKTTDKLETLQKQQKEMEKAGEVNTEAYQKLQSEIEKTGGKLEQLDQKATDAYNELGRPISTEQYDALQREIVDTEQQLHSLETQADKSGTAVAKIADAGGKLEALGGKISGVGQKLAPVSAAAAGVGSAGVAAYNTLEGAYAAIAKGTGAAGDDLKGLKDSFDKVYESIPVEADAAGKAIADINTRFGLTGDALSDCTGQFIKFAQVNDADVSTAIANVSRYMGDAGVDSSRYGEVLDQLTAASQASGLGVDKLSESLTKYGAPMRALGFDAQESIAILSGWEKAGVNTETAFSGMKAAIGKWSKEGKDSREEFKKTLKEIQDCPDIASATSKAIEAFGQKAGPDLADAIKGGRFEYEDFLKIVGGSSGQLDQTFANIETPMDAAKVAMQSLTVSGHDLGEAVIEVLVPMLKALIDIVKKVGDWFSGLGDGQKKIIVIIGLVVAALAPLLIIIGTVISALGGIVPVIAGIVPAIAGIVLPIVAVIAAIGLLVAAFIALYNNNEEFRAGVAEIWNSVQEAISTVVEVIKDVITAFVETGKALWEQYGTGVMAVVTSAFDFVKNVIDTALTFIKNLISVVMAVIRGDWSGAWEGIKKLISDLAEGIKKIISSWMETVKNTIKLAVSVVTGFFTGLKNGVVEIFTNLKTAVGEKVGLVKDSIVEGIGKAVDWVKELPAKALQWGRDFIQGLINGIKGKIGEVGDAVKAIADKIKSFLHFSRPDVGPLREYEAWMPDMMTGLSRGIKDNVWRITDQLSGLTGKISYAVNGPGAAQEGKAADLSKIEGLLSYYLPKGKDGTAIVLDDETLVGRTAPSINKQLADRMRYEGRGMA